MSIGQGTKAEADRAEATFEYGGASGVMIGLRHMALAHYESEKGRGAPICRAESHHHRKAPTCMAALDL